MYGDELWYVSFGSNMLESRFRKYLPDWPATKHGMHDLRRFRRDVTIAHPLYFAGASAVWDDSPVAFVSLRADPRATTYCRAYRVTPAELARIVTGENGIPPIRWSPDFVAPTVGGHVRLDIDDGGDPRRAKYDTVLRVGTIEGVPAVTLTTAKNLERSAPSARYRDAVTAGLRTTAHTEIPGNYLSDAVRRSSPVAA